MKIVGNLILSALVFGCLVAVTGVEVSPLFGNIGWSFLMAAVLTSVVGTFLALPLVFGGAIAGAFVGALGKEADLGASCGALLALPVIYVIEFYVIRHLGVRFDWYPMLSNWSIVGYLVIMGTYSLITSLGNKKK